jgi:hypothetical protein
MIAVRPQGELDRAVAQIGKNATVFRSDISNIDNLDSVYSTNKSKNLDVAIVVFAKVASVGLVPTTAVTLEHFDKTFNFNTRGFCFTKRKNAAANERRRIAHSRQIRRVSEGISRIQRLRRDEDGSRIGSTNLYHRTEGSQDSIK